MIARFDGAASGFGFSTMSVIRTTRSSTFSPATMPYWCVSERGTSCSAITGFPRRSKIRIICPMHGSAESTMSSPSMTAKGWSPTRSRACRTAWPSPRACFWRT